jgi:hypothetical protein
MFSRVPQDRQAFPSGFGDMARVAEADVTGSRPLSVYGPSRLFFHRVMVIMTTGCVPGCKHPGTDKIHFTHPNTHPGNDCHDHVKNE